MHTPFPCLAISILGAANSDADRVLVVENTNSAVSIEIAERYSKLRGAHHLLQIACQDSALDPSQETIPYARFAEQIERPLRAALEARAGIDFVVLTKGIPIRITDAPGLGVSGKRPSVDSYLAAMGYAEQRGSIKLSIHDTEFEGNAYANRFWNSEKPFSHAEHGGYLVTRLDGYSIADAEELVTNAIEAEKKTPTGEILLDTCPEFGFGDAEHQPRPAFEALGADANPAVRIVQELAHGEFNADMVAAARLLKRRGVAVTLDETGAFVAGRAALAGYASWGSNDAQFAADRYRALRFVPGAITETAVSTSARTFLPTTGGQSLIADLIHQHATGAKGYCDEPLLQAIASPTILFDRYARGWTLAESYYAASRFVGWEDIVVGDPICRPYRR